MVSILNYSSAPPPAASSGSGRGGGSGLYPSPADPRVAEASVGGYDRRSSGSDYGYVSVDYGSIAGANTAPDTGSAGYGGGGYAAAGGYGQPQQPAAAAPQSYSYAPQQQQQQQQYAAPPPAAAADYSQQQQYAAPQPAAAVDYGQQQQQQPAAGGYGSAHLMDAVTAPQVCACVGVLSAQAQIADGSVVASARPAHPLTPTHTHSQRALPLPSL